MKKKVKIFYDRKKELSEFKDYLIDLQKSRPKHVLIVAPRRMGKTHLIQKYMLNSVDEKIIPIYVDLLFIDSIKTLSQTIYDQFIENYSIIHKKSFTKLMSLIKGNITDFLDAIKEVGIEFGNKNEDYLALRFNLKKEVNEIDYFIKTLDIIEDISDKKKLKIVLAMDEFQRVIDWKNWKEFVAALRSNMQYSENTQLIISGSKSTFIKENIIAKTKPFWKQLISYELMPFSKEVVSEILQNNNIDKKLADQFSIDVANIPDYVIKLVNIMQTVKNYDDAITKLIDQEKYVFEAIYDKLNTKDRKILKVLSQSGKQFSDIEKEVPKPAYSLKKLLEEDIITLKENKYDISDPIFKKVLNNK